MGLSIKENNLIIFINYKIYKIMLNLKYNISS